MKGARMSSVLVVDGANVVGSRPDGWWRDRAKAAARLHGRLAVADTSYDEIVLVLEGQAKGGVPRVETVTSAPCTPARTATGRSSRPAGAAPPRGTSSR